MNCNCSALSEEDKEVLEFARNVWKEERQSLESKLKANGYEDDELEAFSINQMKTIASKLTHNETEESQSDDGNSEEDTSESEVIQANFSGRGAPKQSQNLDDSEDYLSMETNVAFPKAKGGSE